jgi:hypothetical protein
MMGEEDDALLAGLALSLLDSSVGRRVFVCKEGFVLASFT